MLAIGAGAAALACLTSSALATTVADVRYDPPKLIFTDRFAHATGEDLTVDKEGAEYVLRNPSGMVRHPDSKAGCDENFSTEFHCPVAGVEALTLKLNGNDDRASVDLGGLADSVRQRILAGEGADEIGPSPGPQRILGGAGDDDLRGGKGHDVIDGGEGIDDCRGGPNDLVTNCE